jgi:hypothetical protein
VTLRPATSFAAGLAILGVAAASQAVRVDLTRWVSPLPRVGDYRLYVWSEAGTELELRREVASVEEVPGAWRIVWRSGSVTTEETVRPGVRSRTDEGAYADVGYQLAIDRELRSCDLLVRLGSTRRFRAAFLATGGFVPFVYWTRRLGRYRLAGFEAIETPYAGHGTAARVEAIVKEWRTKPRLLEGFEDLAAGPRHLAWVRRSESWFVRDVGLVGARHSVRRVVSGRLGPEEISELWLKEAVIRGVPYP